MTHPLNPEMQLLVACAQTQPDPPTLETIAQLTQAPLNWPYLLEQATFHKTIPLLQRNLQAASLQAASLQAASAHAIPQSAIPQSAIPQTALDQLQSLTQNNALYALGLTAELARLLNSLERHQIPVIPFKGPTLALLAYGDIADRMSSDLDILLQPADYLKPKSLLVREGYRPEAETYPLPNNERIYDILMGEYGLIHQTSDIFIDVHTRLAAIHPFVFAADFSDVWKRLQPVSLLGKTVFTLSSEDLLLYLCIHGSRDRWNCLSALCDLDGLVRRHPTLNWQFILSEADRLGSTRMLLLGLTLAHRLLHLPLPAAITEKLNGDRQVARLAEPIYHQIYSGTPPTESSLLGRSLFYLAILQRWQDKLHFLTQLPLRQIRLFSLINAKDYAFLRLPRSLYCLYYLIRPIRLLNQYGLGVFKLIFP